MKKVFKNFMFGLMFVLCASFCVPAGLGMAGVLRADALTNGLSIPAFVSSVNVGDYYIVKEGLYNAATTGVTISVTDMYGNAINGTESWETTWTEQLEHEYARFLVTSINPFSVTYKVSVDGKEYSETFKVSPKSTTNGVYFKLPENSSSIIPSKIAIDNTLPIYLPNPVVYDKDDEVLYDTSDEVAEIGSVTVMVTNPAYVPSGQEGGVEIKTDEAGKKYFDGNNLSKGVYTITYKYYTSSGLFVTSLTQTMEVLNTNQYTNDYKLGYKLNSSAPESGVTGVTKDLPSVTGINLKTNETVGVYYSVRAERLENGRYVNVSNETFRDTTVIDGTKFTPNKNGTYRLVYTIKDFFGHVAELSTLDSFKVEDTQAPTPLVVDAENNNKETFVKQNYDHDNIIIPAVGGKDNFSELSEFKLLKRRILNASFREMYSSDSKEDAVKNLIFNYTDAQTVGPNSIIAKDSKGENISLPAGTYTVYYIVQDAAGKESTTSTEFTVAETVYSDTTNPELSFKETFYPSYNKGDKISITPVVSDDKDGSSLRITTSVSLMENGTYGEPIVLNSEDPDFDYGEFAKWVKSVPEEPDFKISKPFVLQIPENTNVTKIKIRLEARDAKNNLGEKEVELVIKNVGDKGAPSFESVTADPGYSYTYEQGSLVTLPTASYTEHAGDNLAYMEAEVNVIHKDGEKVTKIPLEKAATARVINSKFQVSGAQFIASFAGEYQVTYKIMDAGNNVVVNFFTYTVTPVQQIEEPRIDKLPSELNDGKALEFGESLRLPAAEVVYNATKDTAYDINILVDGKKNNSVKDYDFTPKEPGTYKIIYEATIYYTKDATDGSYSAGDVIDTVKSKEFTLKVEDTTAPEIKEVEGLFDGMVMDKMETTDEPFIIPRLQATDASDIDLEKSTITVTSSRSGTTTIKLSTATDSQYEYKFTREDAYTITYTAYDIYGNSSSKAYVVKVGDTVPPVLEVKDDTVPSKISKGGQLTIDPSKITVSDNITEGLKVEDVKIIVRNTTTDKEVSPVRDGEWTYTISDAGTYEVIFEIKDDAGWTTKVTRTFEVSTNANDGTVNVQVIGTVLIVISVLVLAGVIVYFIVSGARNRKKTSKK